MWKNSRFHREVKTRCTVSAKSQICKGVMHEKVRTASSLHKCLHINSWSYFLNHRHTISGSLFTPLLTFVFPHIIHLWKERFTKLLLVFFLKHIDHLLPVSGYYPTWEKSFSIFFVCIRNYFQANER